MNTYEKPQRHRGHREDNKGKNFVFFVSLGSVARWGHFKYHTNGRNGD